MPERGAAEGPIFPVAWLAGASAGGVCRWCWRVRAGRLPCLPGPPAHWGRQLVTLQPLLLLLTPFGRRSAGAAHLLTQLGEVKGNSGKEGRVEKRMREQVGGQLVRLCSLTASTWSASFCYSPAGAGVTGRQECHPTRFTAPCATVNSRRHPSHQHSEKEVRA